MIAEPDMVTGALSHRDWGLWGASGALALALHGGGLMLAADLLPELPEPQAETEVVLELLALTGSGARAERTTPESTTAERVAATQDGTNAASVTAAQTAQSAAATNIAARSAAQRVTGQEPAAVTAQPPGAETGTAMRPDAETITGQAPAQMAASASPIATIASRSAPANAEAANAPSKARATSAPATVLRAEPGAVDGLSTPRVPADQGQSAAISPDAITGVATPPSQPSTLPERIGGETVATVKPVAEGGTAPVTDRTLAAPAPAPVFQGDTEVVTALAPPPPPRQSPGGDSDADGSDTNTGDAAQQARFAAIVEHIRGFDDGRCFAALPEIRAEDGTVVLQGFLQSAETLERLQAELAGQIGIAPQANARRIRAAQCAALDYVRAAPRYPGFRLGLTLENRRIASGSVLTGRITPRPGYRIELLLIDDEGRVQSLGALLQDTPDGGRRFDIPMTVQGEAVSTEQLLLALALPEALETITAFDGSQAVSFFDRLGRETRFLRVNFDAALAGFVVEP